MCLSCTNKTKYTNNMYQYSPQYIRSNNIDLIPKITRISLKPWSNNALQSCTQPCTSTLYKDNQQQVPIMYQQQTKLCLNKMYQYHHVLQVCISSMYPIIYLYHIPITYTNITNKIPLAMHHTLLKSNTINPHIKHVPTMHINHVHC